MGSESLGRRLVRQAAIANGAQIRDMLPPSRPGPIQVPARVVCALDSAGPRAFALPKSRDITMRTLNRCFRRNHWPGGIGLGARKHATCRAPRVLEAGIALAQQVAEILLAVAFGVDESFKGFSLRKRMARREAAIIPCH